MKETLVLTRKNSIIEIILSNIFFCFFTAQILSPEVAGKAIYLEVIFAIFNPYFVYWFFHKKFSLSLLLLPIPLIGIILLGEWNITLKLVAIFISVCFLFYSYERNIFLLENWLLFSIFIAVLQFIFVFFDRDLAYLIGPTSISNFLWGEFSIQTFTNFYTIFLFPRVSGLSRESGFFCLIYNNLYFIDFFRR